MSKTLATQSVSFVSDDCNNHLIQKKSWSHDENYKNDDLYGINSVAQRGN